MSLIEYLSRALAPDVRSWAARLASRIGGALKRRRFGSIAELAHALQAGDLADGAQVEVAGRITPFGPVDRPHILPAFIGPRMRNRRGPAIANQNFIIGTFGHILNHLKPVSLFPPVATGVNQGTLLPADAPVLGFVSMIPVLTPPIPYLNVLYSDRHQPHLNRPSRIRGVARVIGPAAFSSAGFPSERYEILRQQGNIWVLDVTTSDSAVDPFGDATIPELWGGLYAQGHFEYEADRAPRRGFVEACEAAFVRADLRPEIIPNFGQGDALCIIAEGTRMVVDGALPVWSLHADCELTAEFASSMQYFDTLSTSILAAAREAFLAEGVALTNPMDLDFTYRRTADDFTVLSSASASAISDPLMVALREWHRLRNRGD